MKMEEEMGEPKGVCLLSHEFPVRGCSQLEQGLQFARLNDRIHLDFRQDEKGMGAAALLFFLLQRAGCVFGVDDDELGFLLRALQEGEPVGRVFLILSSTDPRKIEETVRLIWFGVDYIRVATYQDQLSN
jgi:hypothetical protein